MTNTEIKEALKKRGSSQKWLSDQIGMKQATFAKKITGHSKFTKPEIIAIKSVLGL